jgi:succinate dehydrogenase hydrophobic anchor subunit
MKDLLKNFEPKKLWLLRIYVKFLEGISSLILVFYCGASIYLMFKESNTFINIIMGATGIYIVIVAVTILILAQVINLFIGIHDNVDDIRKKQLDPNFKYSEADEKLKVRNEQINSIYIICLIILSIIFIIVNFNVTQDKSLNNNVSTNTLETEATNNITDTLKNEQIWKSVYPEESKWRDFDNDGLMILNHDGYQERIKIGAKFNYEKSNKNRLIVIFYTFRYDNGIRERAHVSTAKVSVAHFDYELSKGWVMVNYTDDWTIPQFGYGIDPLIELKTYNNTQSLYINLDDGNGGKYEYYYDIESLKQMNNNK